MDDKCNDLTIPKWIEINSIVLKMMMETWQMWECKQIGEPWEDRAPCKPEGRWSDDDDDDNDNDDDL